MAGNGPPDLRAPSLSITVYHWPGGLQEMLRVEGPGWRQHPGQGCLNPAPPPSSPQDALCTPARRLLQDSQDVPVTVTPLRAERVLLFDDVLVLLQVGGVLTGGGGWSGVWLKKG